jgi:hypothetical protein
MKGFRGFFNCSERVRRLGFAVEYEKWINMHMSKRRGERKDALVRGQQSYGNQLFAEAVWWNLMEHFTGLHPEYEVKDWRGRSYYTDFVWNMGGLRFVFEIMDYGSHGKERSKYRLDLNRAMYLQSQEYHVTFISLDELKENASFVLSIVRSILGPYLAAADDKHNKVHRDYGRIERQLMRLAIRQNRIVFPSKAAKELELHKQTVIKYCRSLADKGKFRAVPSGSSGKIYQYEYVGSLQSPDLW